MKPMKSMRVLLINPPSQSPQPVMPLGLAYLAAALEQDGFPVSVIDAWAEGLDFPELKRRIAALDDVGLIGVTMMSPTYPTALETIRTARAACPRARIVTGGTHPSALPKQPLRDCPELDFTIAGEGDELIVMLARRLSGENVSFSEMPGLYRRRDDADGADGDILGAGSAVPLKDLDRLPLPSRHLFPTEFYKIHPPYRLYHKFATMITSRGCPYKCTYCTKSVSGRNFRYRSTEKIIAEIRHLIETRGVRQIHFYDDDFTINKRRVAELCDELIAQKIKIAWSCVTRVDLVDEPLLDKMKRSGCFLIAYGVESGNQAVLDRASKGYKIDAIKTAFRLTKKAGIRTLGYFMAGLPGETKETLQETVRLSFALDPNFVSWSITVLYPGSELYRMAQDGELGAVRPASAGASDDALIVSSQSPFAQGHALVYQGELSREYMAEVIDRAYKMFYFRVGFVFRFVFQLKTFTEAWSYVKTFFQYLSPGR